MANDKDFIVKDAVEVGGSVKTTVGTLTSGSEGYNLSVASYDNKSFSVASQDTNANGFIFNATGTKLYVVGRTNQSIFQYSLSTSYDISTASYDSVSFSVAAQETNPIEAFFKSDGTKLYVIGWDGDAVFQYGLTTAYDISTASYDSVSFSFASQDAVAASIYFKPDGTKFYIMGAINDAVFQYSLSTAWDMSTASYDSVSFSFSSQETNPYGLLFNNDGTKMFITGNTSDATFQYSLTTAWDLSTASYDSVSLDHTTVMTDPFGTRFNSDGSKFYVVASNDTIYQYSTTLTTKSLDLSTGSVFEITPTSDIQINLSNPADSGTVSQATLLLDGAATTTYSFSDLSDDSKSYAYTPEPNGIFFKPDGSKLFTMSNSAVAYQHTLTDPNDITTASYDSVSFSLASQDAGMSGLFFKSDGTKIYGVGSVTDTVYQYSLSTAWDLSTASYDSVSLSVSAQDSIPVRLFFKPDGTKMYVDGANGKKIFQYSLSTAWDLSTASYDSISYTYSSTLSYDLGQFFFTSDGTSLYFISAAVPSSAASEQVVGYSTLSTAWDISTIGVRSTFSISSLDTTPYGVQFSVDGVKLFVSGAQNDKVYQLNSSTGATITYPSTLEWPSGTAPTSPAIGDTDVLTFSTTDGGTSYQAVQAINGAK